MVLHITFVKNDLNIALFICYTRLSQAAQAGVTHHICCCTCAKCQYLRKSWGQAVSNTEKTLKISVFWGFQGGFGVIWICIKAPQ